MIRLIRWMIADLLTVNDERFAVGSDLINGDTLTAKAVFPFARQVISSAVYRAVKLCFVENNGLFRLMAACLCYRYVYPRACLSHYDATLHQITTNCF